jgi:hypothetical protein
MKGSIGTATYLSYTRPYWGKVISKLNYIDKLSPQAKVRYKAINLYSSGDYSIKQICEIFEINRYCVKSQPTNSPLDTVFYCKYFKESRQ